MFCFAKFIDPDFSEEHTRHVAEHPDVLTESYTTTASHEQGADYHWICKPCFDDFAERFASRVVPPTPNRARPRRRTSHQLRRSLKVGFLAITPGNSRDR